MVGVSRSGALPADSPQDLTPGQLAARVMDLRDPLAVERTIQGVVESLGRLDAIVHAAGIAVAGPLENIPIALIREQFEANLLGTAYLIRAAVPYLRRFAPSRIVHISSIAAHVALPYQAVYCASKFAAQGLCESLRYELNPQGIRMIVVEPGSVRTPLTQNRRIVPSGGTCRDAARRALEVNDADERQGIDPERVARLVERVLNSDSPPERCSVGHWQERLTLPARRLLPSRWFRRIIAAHYRISSAPFE